MADNERKRDAESCDRLAETAKEESKRIDTYLNIKRGTLPITEKYADTVLSIPLYNGMTEEEQDYIISVLNKF